MATIISYPTFPRAISVAATLAALASGASASSEDAWETFRADVEAKCRALAPVDGATAIEVNPFGSERFGAAIVTTTVKDGTADRAICIYNKQAKTAEMTAPFSGSD